MSETPYRINPRSDKIHHRRDRRGRIVTQSKQSLQSAIIECIETIIDDKAIADWISLTPDTHEGVKKPIGLIVAFVALDKVEDATKALVKVAEGK